MGVFFQLCVLITSVNFFYHATIIFSVIDTGQQQDDNNNRQILTTMDVEMMEIDSEPEDHDISNNNNHSYEPEKTMPLLIVDTNFLISNLDILNDLRQLAPKYNHRIVIPYSVIQELDNLKDAKRHVKHPSRKAINWIQEYFSANDEYVIGQQLTQINQVNLRGDDSILDCCLFFQQHYNALTVIVTNDKNLCVKALVHHIRTISFTNDMTAQKISDMVRQEAKGLKAIPEEIVEMEIDKNMTLEQKIEYFEEIILQHLTQCIDQRMHEAYSDAELQYFGYDNNFRDTADISECLQKFGIGVFSEFVPKAVIEKAKKTPSPITEKDLQSFLDSWGGVWLHLAPKDQTEEIKNELKHWKSL